MSGICYKNYVALNNYRNQCAYVVGIWLLQYTWTTGAWRVVLPENSWNIMSNKQKYELKIKNKIFFLH